MQKIYMYNAHCCGEIGDVVIGLENLKVGQMKKISTKQINSILKTLKWIIYLDLTNRELYNLKVL